MADPIPGLAPCRQRLRDNRLLLAVDFLLVAAVFVADQHHLILFSKTPYLLVLGWISMAVRGVGWRDLGLCAGPRWAVLLLAGVAAGVAMEALELFATQPLLVKLAGKYPNLSDFKDLVGNFKLLLILVIAAWVVAGRRTARESKPRRQSTQRAGRHANGSSLSPSQDKRAGKTAGLLLGGLYLASGRNLMVPIIAHGVTDTVDLLIIYSGHYPGM